MWAEVFADGDVEANPVGGDVAVTPRSVEQDVAYAGPCHVRSRYGPAGCLPDDDQVMALVAGTTWPSICGAFAAASALLRRILDLGDRLVGLRDGPLRGLDLLTIRYPTPAQMPAISSSAPPTIKNASHAARPAATRPKAAAK